MSNRGECNRAEAGRARPCPTLATQPGCKLSAQQTLRPLLFVSGLVSTVRGAVATEVTPQAAKLAARDTMLDLLALVKHDIGDLDLVASVEQVRGFVRSAPDFTAQPEIIDGASDLLIAVWGEAGRHARTATGVSQLPHGGAIQLEMILRLGD